MEDWEEEESEEESLASSDMKGESEELSAICSLFV